MREDLLKRARAGIGGSRRLRSVYLRRSVSDAYYALFHALAELCADSLIGVTKHTSEAWRRVYRGLDHGPAKSELNQREMRQLHPNVDRIAAAFLQLQEARHKADYDPASDLRRRSDAEAFVAIAETAISDLDALPLDIRQEFAARLLFKKRS
jgi:hypothetical protein